MARRLGEPGPVTPGPVGDDGDGGLWEATVARHHPLGWARPPGGQVRHWIRPERHGVLGAVGFGSATWSLAARDRWIGRAADARAANIGRVVRDHRFPILPGVRVHGLASHVPPMAADRVADDWQARYSVRPVAAYTHVGKEHSGNGYRSAGWISAGSTSGRRGAAGTVMVLALEDGWREALHHLDRRPVGTLAGLHHGAGDMGWAEREHRRSGHTDGRVRRRIAGMGRAWMENMGEDLPVIFPTRAGRKAAYRPLSNPGVTMRHVPEPHHEATADRCRAEPVILAERDTTTINHSHLRATESLPETGGGGSGSVGVLAHAGLAVTPEGRPPGPFAMDAGTGRARRTTATAGSTARRGRGSPPPPARTRGWSPSATGKATCGTSSRRPTFTATLSLSGRAARRSGGCRGPTAGRSACGTMSPRRTPPP